MSKVRKLRENCEKKAGDNIKLPTNAFLVTYVLDAKTQYDLCVAMKKVDIFDQYWDNYRGDLKDIQQAKGTVSPKLWNGNIDD